MFIKYLKKNFLSRPLIYLIIIVCQIILITVSILCSGIFINERASESNALYNSKYISLRFSQNEQLGNIREKLAAFIETIDGEYQYVQIAMPFEQRREFFEAHGFWKFPDYNTFAEFMETQFNMPKDKIISEPDFNSGEKVTMVGSVIGSDSLKTNEDIVDNTVVLEGEKYYVKSRYNGYGCYILVDAAPDSAVVYGFDLLMNSPVSEKKTNEITENFLNIFGRDGEISTRPQINDLMAEQMRVINIFVTVMIIFIAAFNMSLLYRIIIKANANKLAVFKMCGMTSKTSLAYLSGEILIYSFFCGIAGITIFNMFIKNTVAVRYEIFETLMTAPFIMLFMFVYMLLSFGVTYIYIYPIMKKVI